LKMEKQIASGNYVEMVHPSTSRDIKSEWRSIDWNKAWREVKRLQMYIAKAVKEEDYGRVKSLQWILTHSFYAKALAVKRVTSNKGKNTPGIDGVLWKTAKAKMQAIYNLRQHGYKAQPLKRIYIPKKSGNKKRPLSIPTMHDRAMQALYKLALIPVAETTADRNSYGFRESRSCADAIAAAFNALSKPNSATWILEADIKGCYDNIAKSWLLKNIPIEKRILLQWLNAGYIEKGFTYPTRKGVPQGGIVSCVLANMTLDGLEKIVLQSAPRRSRVNFIRYADDFIITAKSRTILEKYILPAVKRFLGERGLELSEDKTKVTYIRDGFTFLGQTFRKHGNTLHIIPEKEGVLALIRKIGMIIRKYVKSPLVIMVKKLNEVLRGWAYYHRHIVASEAFSRVDNYVFDQLWQMLRKRHPKKSKKWLAKRYWRSSGNNASVFTVTVKIKGKSKHYQVFRASAIGIKRHRKVKADANPYMPEYRKYFWIRRHHKEATQLQELSARRMRMAAAS
jgi:RNA-directed DNA polymerase